MIGLNCVGKLYLLNSETKHENNEERYHIYEIALS